MHLNTVNKNTARTHEGAPALPENPLKELRKAVSSCLLWEDQFYESGEDIAKRISSLAAVCNPVEVANLAIYARQELGLRHAPLWLIAALVNSGKTPPAFIYSEVIRRADEMGELIAMVWKDGKHPLPHQMKVGIGEAFKRFDAYQLGKYNRKTDIKLRDVLRICHPKPNDSAQSELWKQVIDGSLASPDTWEVALSAGADKRETFTRLIKDGKLGYLALLRNLCNMENAKVDKHIIRSAIRERKGAKNIFPFRFAAAAKAAPEFEEDLDEAFLATLRNAPRLPGRTVVVIDVSGSMQTTLSAKSDMTRVIASCALGAIAREVCEDAAIYATAGSDRVRIHKTEKIPARRGLALIDGISSMMIPLGGGGIFTKQVCDYLREKEGEVDRMIVITDEQDCGIGSGDSPLDAVPIGKQNYMINVSSYKNGIAYGKWTAINGFSEGVMRYIFEDSRMQ